ncbi:hypothetical protein IM697_22165 [Streptomyces ferrugineus]|uniref:Uncharacterized protein n=1 Tax=Streptomyces ferrugineus TaxID=1413221 RepID=A0A7M2T012_9ACTN|nr:hypothetical protein [Streptomyces ferrugineus]QOV40851.1 hypothetical protein IM697_22165 [Streptomyces ferrugineus]
MTFTMVEASAARITTGVTVQVRLSTGDIGGGRDAVAWFITVADQAIAETWSAVSRVGLLFSLP